MPRLKLMMRSSGLPGRFFSRHDFSKFGMQGWQRSVVPALAVVKMTELAPVVDDQLVHSPDGRRFPASRPYGQHQRPLLDPLLLENAFLGAADGRNDDVGIFERLLNRRPDFDLKRDASLHQFLQPSGGVRIAVVDVHGFNSGQHILEAEQVVAALDSSPDDTDLLRLGYRQVPGGYSDRAAVRRAVIYPASIRARGCPVVTSFSTIRPMIEGNPWR